MARAKRVRNNMSRLVRAQWTEGCHKNAPFSVIFV